MSGILGLSTPWARGRVREPLREELTALIPDGYMVGVSVSANNGPVIVWVNAPGRTKAHSVNGYYDAESAIRSAIRWAVADAQPLRVTVTTVDGWVTDIEESRDA